MKYCTNRYYRASAFQNARKAFWLTFAMLTAVFWLSARAQEVVIDGDVDDWCPNPPDSPVYTGIIQDPFNTPGADNVFTLGSKDGQDIPQWAWFTSKAEGKNDLEQGGAAFYGTGHMYFFATRFDTTGSSETHAWFLQDPNIGLNPDGTFSGHHIDGDVLLVSAFIQGGGTASIQFYTWQNGALVPVNNPPATSLKAVVNSTEQIFCASPPYQEKGKSASNVIPVGGFIEGFADLTSIPGFNFNPCFSKFLIATRSSGSSQSSSLDDFLMGSFLVRPIATITCPGAICQGQKATITASVQGGKAPYTFHYTLPDGTVINHTGVTGTTDSLADQTQNGTYSLVVDSSAIAGAVCSSDSVSCTLTVNPVPTCTITGNNGPICPNASGSYSGPADADSWSWTISGDAKFSDGTTTATGQNVSVKAGADCGSFTLTLTTSKNGCAAPACTKNVDVKIVGKPTLTVGLKGGQQPCNFTPPTKEEIQRNSSAVDACGGTATVNVPSVTSSIANCVESLTFTITATDVCGNTSDPQTLSYTWRVDTAPPVFSNCPTGPIDLGCNPTLPDCTKVAALKITASDVCSGSITPTCAALDSAPVSTSTCGFKQTFRLTAVDACGNSGTCDVTYTWKSDAKAPIFQNCPSAPIDLGCNPTAPTCTTVQGTVASLKITATDACTGSSITPTCAAKDTAPVANGTCGKKQTFTLTAVDSCGKSSTCDVTYIWTVDTTAPVVQNCPSAPIDLGCNPTPPTCDTVAGTVTALKISASDACSGSITPTCAAKDRAPVANGTCGWKQTFTLTWTDRCSNKATCDITYTWTVSTGPSVSCPSDIKACEGDQVSYQTPTGSGCGTVTVNCVPKPGPSGSGTSFPLGTTTVTCTATDGCQKTSQCSFTVTVLEKVSVAVTAQQSVCAQDAAMFTATPSGAPKSGSNFEFEWTLVVSSSQSFEFTASSTLPAGISVNTFNGPTSTLTIHADQFTSANLAPGQQYEVKVKAIGYCGSATASGVLEIQDCGTYCSLTQGFYGNLKGKFMGIRGVDLVEGLLSQELTVGVGQRSIKLHADDVSCLIQRLPAGGPSAAILPAATAAGWDICAITPNNYGAQLDKKGIKFRNNLLGQTITLGLNMRLLNKEGIELGHLVIGWAQGSRIEAVPLCTQPVSFDKATDSFVREGDCSCTGSISVTVLAAMAALDVKPDLSLARPLTVDQLKRLADQALGGNPAYSNMLDEIQGAVDMVNEAFDECRAICPTTDMKTE